MKTMRIAMVAGAMVAVFGASAAAEAMEVRARCDYKAPSARGTGERTRVRVDGKDVPAGEYTVTVNGTYATTVTAAIDDDEMEFSARFSSHAGHVAEGAVAIPSSLGAEGEVTLGVAGLVEEVVLLCPGRTRIDVQ